MPTPTVWLPVDTTLPLSVKTPLVPTLNCRIELKRCVPSQLLNT
jgi:hypothetical protein